MLDTGISEVLPQEAQVIWSSGSGRLRPVTLFIDWNR